MNEMLFYYIIPFKEWNVYKSINYVTTFILYMFPLQIEKKSFVEKKSYQSNFCESINQIDNNFVTFFWCLCYRRGHI